ncbi:MAG TPA: DUF2752 domain-containing protein [Mycobacteriales bacterium]|nr:DUF2752 domain-containing protein [Mycobacteriales bacterium]
MTAGHSVSADRGAPFLTALAAGAGCVYLALNDPNDPGALMPACPTKLLTGLDCPACGGLRMVRALLYGDVGAAAHANAFLLVLAPVVVALWALWCRDAARGRPRRPVLSRPAAVVFLTVAAAWTLARNLA